MDQIICLRQTGHNASQAFSRAPRNASTFQPYDPSDTIGDTAPTAAKPPKKNKCGAFGQVLLVVVAAVVTYFTAGAAAALGPTLAGVVGGAAGSVASQAVGVATGIQDKFSWNAVATAAISGGISGGSTAAFGVGKNAVQAALRGAANNIATQGISAALGLQKKFSWAGVAAAGIGSGVAFGVGRELGIVDGTTGNIADGKSLAANRGVANIAAHTARYGASAIADAATRSAIDGSSFSDGLRAAIPNVIGQVIGDLTIGNIQSPETVAERARESPVFLDTVAPSASGQVEGLIPARLDGTNFKGQPVDPDARVPDSGEKSPKSSASQTSGSVLAGLLSGIIRRSPIGVVLGLSELNDKMGGGLHYENLSGLGDDLRRVWSSSTPTIYIEGKIDGDWTSLGSGERATYEFDDGIVTPGIDFQSGNDRWFVPLDGEERRIVHNGEVLGLPQGGTIAQVLAHRLNDGVWSRTRTTDEIRNSRGTAFASNELRDIDGPWLFDGPAQIPKQVAAKLEDREFSSMKAFREALWKSVADVPELATQFNKGNIARMQEGRAPFVRGGEAVGKLDRFIIHHKTEIQFGGAVYDMSNMLIVTPKQHHEIHYGKKQ